MSACRKSCSAPGVFEMSPRQVDRRPAGGGRGGRGWRGWSAREGARHRKGGESAGTRWWGLGAWKRKVRFSGTVRAIIIQKVIKYQNRLLYFHPIIIYIIYNNHRNNMWGLPLYNEWVGANLHLFRRWKCWAPGRSWKLPSAQVDWPCPSLVVRRNQPPVPPAENLLQQQLLGDSCH